MQGISIILCLTLIVNINSASSSNDKRVGFFNLPTHDDTTDDSLGGPCTEVGNEFVELALGDRTLVPSAKIADSNLEVCVNHGHREVNRVTCCSRDMERRYHQAAERDFASEYLLISDYLKNMLADDVQYYKEEYVNLLSRSKTKVDDVFSMLYQNQIPFRNRHGTITSLFTDLRAYLTNQEVDIMASVEKFFTDLFPDVFFYNSVSPSDGSELDADYRDCLRRVYSQLSPKPFGDIPNTVSHQLRNGLSVTNLFLVALELGAKTVNVTTNVSMDIHCTRAMTRLQYCARCDGHVNARACNGFCLNVMHGCLATVIDTNSHWNAFIQSLLAMASTMSELRHNVEQQLLGLPKQIDDAIMLSMENAHKFYEQIIQQEHCGPIKTVDGQSGHTVNQPQTRLGTRVALTNSQSISAEDSITTKIQTSINRLKQSRDFYHNLAERICGSEKFVSTNVMCWNGSAVDTYMAFIPDRTFEQQVRGNPEVNVPAEKSPQLIAITQKLTAITKLMTSQVGGETMQNDEAVVDERAGQHGRTGRFYKRYHRWHGYENGPVDDEDQFSGSGSGSGDYYYPDFSPPYQKGRSDLDSTNKQDDDIYIDRPPNAVYTDAPYVAAAPSLLSSLVTVAMTTMIYVVIWLNG